MKKLTFKTTQNLASTLRDALSTIRSLDSDSRESLADLAFYLASGLLMLMAVSIGAA